MTELNFDNVTFKYDKSVFSKKIKMKVETIRFLGIFFIIALLVFLFFCLRKFIDNFFLLSLYGTFLGIIIILIGSILLDQILRPIRPIHYNLIKKLIKKKKYNLQFLYFHNKIVFAIWNDYFGWKICELYDFFNNSYEVIDKSDKRKDLYLIIDLTKSKTELLVKNK